MVLSNVFSACLYSLLVDNSSTKDSTTPIPSSVNITGVESLYISYLDKYSFNSSIVFSTVILFFLSVISTFTDSVIYVKSSLSLSLNLYDSNALRCGSIV